MTSRFFPTPFLLSGHLSTIFAATFRKNPTLPYRREIVSAEDGGEISLDWIDNTDDKFTDKTRPTLVILHGLTGDSDAYYVKHIVQAVTARGFRVVVMNNRGSGGAALRTPMSYSASFTGDIRTVVQHVKAAHDGPLFAIGISLGSIILVKYLAECGIDCPLTAAMGVSNPWCLQTSTRSLERPASRLLYNEPLAKRLRSIVENNLPLFQAHPTVKVDTVLATRTIREFDAAFICPLFGYKTVEDYYDDASSANHIQNVRIPLVMLNAADDPFAPVDGIPVDKLRASDSVLLVLTRCGGHVAFCEGWHPVEESFMERLLVQYIDAIMKIRAEDPC